MSGVFFSLFFPRLIFYAIFKSKFKSRLDFVSLHLSMPLILSIKQLNPFHFHSISRGVKSSSWSATKQVNQSFNQINHHSVKSPTFPSQNWTTAHFPPQAHSLFPFLIASPLSTSPPFIFDVSAISSSSLPCGRPTTTSALHVRSARTRIPELGAPRGPRAVAKGVVGGQTACGNLFSEDEGGNWWVCLCYFWRGEERMNEQRRGCGGNSVHRASTCGNLDRP